MTMKLTILRELNTRKDGINAHKLFQICKGSNFNSFRAYVSNLVTGGYINVRPAVPCNHCGSPGVHYSITAMGRACLAKEPI